MSLFDRLVRDAADEWLAYVDHPFVRGLGDGSLPKASFQHYLIQDYLFLIQFARAYALAVYKSSSLAEMRKALEGMKAILDVEMELHVRLCANWGMDRKALESAPEAKATMAYTRYVLETGLAGDLLDLKVALAPCVIGYAEIARELAKDPNALSPENPYRGWVEEYSQELYWRLAEDAKAELDDLASRTLTEARYPQILRIFRQACLLEADFWETGLTRAA